MSASKKPVKAGDVFSVLRKLGFTSTDKSGRVRLFTHKDGTFLTTPFDPEELMPPKWLWWILRDVRLTEQDFERLLKAS
jgi:predicted RNA binding protein YcfA (HicA-like mRNA interferase family)